MAQENENTPKVWHLAEIAKLEAETAAALLQGQKFGAEAAYNTALARKVTADAAMAEVNMREKDRLETSVLAQDYFHRVYTFNGSVGSQSAGQIINQLSEWHRIDQKDGTPRPIEIIINSPGGSVIDGMAVFDFIKYLRRDGHHITTTTLGMAASMGGILLQAGDKRVMGKEAYVLIHEIAFGAGGKMQEVEDEVAFGKKIQKRILDILAERSSLTARQIQTRWSRKDWWLDSDEALQLGFVDEVR